jgi:hypothetical protein
MTTNAIVEIHCRLQQQFHLSPLWLEPLANPTRNRHRSGIALGLESIKILTSCLVPSLGIISRKFFQELPFGSFKKKRNNEYLIY